jgi:hypothetical protein
VPPEGCSVMMLSGCPFPTRRAAALVVLVAVAHAAIAHEPPVRLGLAEVARAGRPWRHRLLLHTGGRP